MKKQPINGCVVLLMYNIEDQVQIQYSNSWRRRKQEKTLKSKSTALFISVVSLVSIKLSSGRKPKITNSQ